MKTTARAIGLLLRVRLSPLYFHLFISRPLFISPACVSDLLHPLSLIFSCLYAQVSARSEVVVRWPVLAQAVSNVDALLNICYRLQVSPGR